MNFAFREEQEELRASARAFLAEHSSSEAVRAAMQSELGYDPELWKRIGGELGWPGLTLPEEHGGVGLGAVELVALMEPMGEFLLCSPFFASICLGAQAILEAGNPEQHARFLPCLAEGTTRATLAATVPDRAGEEFPLRARSEGSEIVLEGTQRFVIDGHSADWIVVSAREATGPGAEGPSLFVVAGDAPGLQRKRLPTMDQTRPQAELHFEAVRVPERDRLGAPGSAGPALQRTLDHAAIALAAEQVGGAQRCLDLSVAYSLERVQFGRPIGSFQAIKHKCADMMVRVETARSAAYYAGCVAAERPEELAPVASLAKITCSEAFYHCAAESIQIHGGVGFTWEYDPHLYFKRARAGEALLGTPSWHRERIAGHIGL